ncbi:MAG: FG-GAP repeat protein [Deltaproteobacteria bacterium]|nr:FG-GAP repeat protein [Deltaproteobacteria bacterium]
MEDPTPARAACDPALTLTPASSVVETRGFVQLVGGGGTGDHRFALQEDATGAEVNSTTGAYLAGPVDGIDRIVVRDDGCDGEAAAQIEVVGPLIVAPEATRVPPGTGVSPAVTGGSGSWSCEMTVDGSGPTLAGCAYTAGPDPGLDILRITDDATGAFGEVQIEVGSEHALRAAGEGGMFVVAGSPAAVWTVGGSGEVTLQPAGDLTVDGNRVSAETGASGTITVQDLYSPELSVDLPVTGVGARVPELARDGERSGQGVVLGLGDVDGDNLPDAALAFIESSIGAYYSGAVAIYGGNGAGLDAVPARVIGGTDAMQTLGRSVAAADLDGDGLVDLLVGADRTDRGVTNNGALMIYSGVAGQYFSDEPTRVLYGRNAYARFGSAVAVCDFDGDGFLDLAVGAMEDIDEAVAEPAVDQGAVHVFRGAAGGFDDEANFILHGKQWSLDDGWASTPGMNLGVALAAGDFDGDGLCDLAAGASEASFDGEARTGAVFLYLGTLENAALLTRDPALVLEGAGGGQLGRRLSMGDVNGDGRADLAATAWDLDGAASGVGAVRLLRGRAVLPTDGGERVPAGNVDWSVLGTTSFERVGTDVHLADQDGDGDAELLIGVYRGEVGIGVNEGVIRQYDADTLSSAPPGHDATGEPPDRELEGPAAQARFGQAVAFIDDTDGDGMREILGLAGFDSSEGIESGGLYAVDGGGSSSLEPLQVPGVASGHEVGRGVLLHDMDGDSTLDLVVGVPGAGSEDSGANSGRVEVYPGLGGGVFGDLPVPRLGGHDTHSSSDHFGYAVRSAGDFDGDGWEDLAVVARKGGRPSAFDSDEVANPDDCPGAASSVGEVFVYRGGPAGIADEPSFVWYGLESSAYVYEIEGGFDRNGDGYDDLAVASRLWGDGGGFAFVRGRPADEGLTVICEEESYDATSRFDDLGSSIAVLGDLDSDGCDEVAVGAARDEVDYFNQGIVRVMWGFGASCTQQARVTSMALNIVGAECGSALASGRDVDGDGVVDLAVGGAAFRADFSEFGAVFLVSGAFILSLEPELHSEGSLPGQDLELLHLMLPGDGMVEQSGLIGTEAGGLFGDALAMVPDPSTPGRGAVAIGVPQGDLGGTELAGGVVIHRWVEGPDVDGLEPLPFLVLAGESASPGGLLGSVLRTGLGDLDDALLVGAPNSDAGGLDQGAVYFVRLP